MKPRRSVNMTVLVERDAAEPEVAVGPREDLLDDGLGDEPREDVADTLALERREQVVRGERADGRGDQRAERIDERHDPAVVERDLRRHTRKPAAAPIASTSVRERFRRRLASGDRKPSTMIKTRLTQRGTSCQRQAARTVAIAFAWISGPGISSCPNETGWTSWSDGAEAPTTTILLRKNPGGNRPL